MHFPVTELKYVCSCIRS